MRQQSVQSDDQNWDQSQSQSKDKKDSDKHRSNSENRMNIHADDRETSVPTLATPGMGTGLYLTCNSQKK